MVGVVEGRGTGRAGEGEWRACNGGMGGSRLR